MDQESAQSAKGNVRREVRATLRAMSETQRKEGSAAIIRSLTASDKWIVSDAAVSLFGGLKNEPDLRPLLPWLAERSVPAVLFAVVGDDLVPYRVRDESDLIEGPMGVWEPNRASCNEVAVAELGTILVPGLAFGLDGSRLGRGKGYYDRLLNHPMCNARRIGVGFAVQQMESVPHEAHDARVHALVSEAGWRDVASGREIEEANSGEFSLELTGFFSELFG